MNLGGDIYVLGGHKLSCVYLENILKAREAGLISFARLTFIEEKKSSTAENRFRGQAQGIQKSYADFIKDAIEGKIKINWDRDILIPDHTAPHVLFQLFTRLLEDGPEGKFQTQILPYTKPLGLPYQKTFDSGVCAISNATWVCPLECEEPDHCPAIDNSRSWHFDQTFFDLRKTEETQDNLIHPFFCSQLAYGVAQLPFSRIRSEWDRLSQRLRQGGDFRFLVATYSKCHGIIGLAEVKNS